jgi:hypothetical protein
MFMPGPRRPDQGSVCLFLRVAPFHKRGVGIDEVFQGQAAIHEGLHRRGSVTVRIPLNPGGMVGHLVHHLPVGMDEIKVGLEEVAVAKDMGHHQFLVNQMVAFKEVGIAGVVIDDHLIDFRQSIGITFGDFFKLHAEGPMGIALGEAAVSGDLIDFMVVEDFKDDREEFQPVPPGMVLDLILHPFQFRGEFLGGRMFQQFSSILLIFI